MPAAFLLIEQDPPEAESEKHPGNQRRDKTQCGLTPAYWMIVDRQNFDFPGAHTQGLAAVRPEPGKEKKADADQINRIEKLIRGKGNAGVEWKYRGSGGKQNRRQ